MHPKGTSFGRGEPHPTQRPESVDSPQRIDGMRRVRLGIEPRLIVQALSWSGRPGVFFRDDPLDLSQALATRLFNRPLLQALDGMLRCIQVVT